MSIPALQANGELPPGEHQTSLKEVESVFGSSNDRRKLLMLRLREAARNFELSGVRTIWVNGSFVTDKEQPNDIDGVGNTRSQSMQKRLIPYFYSALEKQ